MHTTTDYSTYAATKRIIKGVALGAVALGAYMLAALT